MTFYNNSEEDVQRELEGDVPCLDAEIERFNGRAQDLVRDADIAVAYSVLLNTTHRMHLTCPLIVKAVKEFEFRRGATAAAAAARAE